MLDLEETFEEIHYFKHTVLVEKHHNSHLCDILVMEDITEKVYLDSSSELICKFTLKGQSQEKICALQY